MLDVHDSLLFPETQKVADCRTLKFFLSTAEIFLTRILMHFLQDSHRLMFEYFRLPVSNITFHQFNWKYDNMSDYLSLAFYPGLFL